MLNIKCELNKRCFVEIQEDTLMDVLPKQRKLVNCQKSTLSTEQKPKIQFFKDNNQLLSSKSLQ